MKEYLKLFPNGFDDTLAERRALENWPFVGYDELTEELVFTIIPKPRIQQNNEVWYTTSDGEINPFNDQYCDATLVSNTYENGIGIAVFDKDITKIYASYVGYGDMSGHVKGFIGSVSGDYVDGCHNISKVESLCLPNSLEEIGELSLCYGRGNQCLSMASTPTSSLKEITFGKNVKVIKGNLFNLDKVYYKGTSQEYDAITFLDNYYDSTRYKDDFLKSHGSIVSGNANPANGAELIFI